MLSTVSGLPGYQIDPLLEPNNMKKVSNRFKLKTFNPFMACFGNVRISLGLRVFKDHYVVKDIFKTGRLD